MTQKDKRTNICFNFIDLSHLQQVSWFLKNIVTKKSRRRFWVCPAAQEISGLKIHGQLRTTNIEKWREGQKDKDIYKERNGGGGEKDLGSDIERQ